MIACWLLWQARTCSHGEDCGGRTLNCTVCCTFISVTLAWLGWIAVVHFLDSPVRCIDSRSCEGKVRTIWCASLMGAFPTCRADQAGGGQLRQAEGQAALPAHGDG